MHRVTIRNERDEIVTLLDVPFGAQYICDNCASEIVLAPGLVPAWHCKECGQGSMLEEPGSQIPIVSRIGALMLVDPETTWAAEGDGFVGTIEGVVFDEKAHARDVKAHGRPVPGKSYERVEEARLAATVEELSDPDEGA